MTMVEGQPQRPPRKAFLREEKDYRSSGSEERLPER